MIKVTVFSDESGAISRFRVEGHSGFAKSGSDIVCAAVSMLVINTISSIEKFCEDTYQLESNEKDGLIQVAFVSRPTNECKLLLDAMLLGLDSVKSQYGKKFISIIYKETAQC